MSTLVRMHPLCCFAYLIAAMGITIFTRSPLLLVESAVGVALLLISMRKGGVPAFFPIIIAVSALTNPLFSHNGVTVLFFAGDIAFTLESLVYGAVFGTMLAAVFGWSVASAEIITSDKFIWLFGRILPSAGLVLSCVMRFIPLFIRRARSFAASQDAASLSEQLRAFSASVGYSAEAAMSSADSMKARGYGSAKRTSFSLYRMGRAEISVLITVVLLFAASVALTFVGAGEYYYYPALSEISFSAEDILLYIMFGVLCLLPSVAVLYEKIKRRFAFRETIREVSG